MSAELAEEAPTEPGDGPPRFSRWVTGVALGILGVLAALLFWPAHGLDTLDRPEQSLERVVASDMDFRAAARTAPAWERRLHAARVRLRRVGAGRRARLVRRAGPGRGLAAGRALPDRPARRGRPDGGPRGRRDHLGARGRLGPPARDVGAGGLRGRAAAAGGAPGSARRSPPGAARRLVRRPARGPAGVASRRCGGGRGGGARHRRAGHPAALASPRHPRRRGAARRGWDWWRSSPGSPARAPAAARVATAPIPPRWTAADGVGLFARGAVGLVGVAVVWPFLPDAGWSTLLVAVLQTIPLGGYLLWFCRRSWSDPRRDVRAPRLAGVRAGPRAGHPRARGRVDPRRRADRARGHARRSRDALDRRLPGAARVGHAGRGGRGRPRQLRLRAAPGGAAVPRGALRDAQARPRARAGDPRQRRASSPWRTATGQSASPRCS